MAIHQHVLALVELCARKGLHHAVISPGSRSAPLTLALARHPHIKTYVVADERSAGFIALGLAQQLRMPVIVVCTSGSAVYNLAPAVAEAYFQETPLLLLTADRPKEWIHQLDGQTIYQQDIFGKHVRYSAELPADYGHPDAAWAAERIANEAINQSLLAPRGPVHLNIPLREPLYPVEGEAYQFPAVREIEQLTSVPALAPSTWHRLQEEWERADRKLIAVGQHRSDGGLRKVLAQLGDEWAVPILGDSIANLGSEGPFIGAQDVFMGNLPDAAAADLRPDLLITCGQSFLSKGFKQFLRKYKPRQHWHIQAAGPLADPFQTVTMLIPYEPRLFFQKLFEDLDFQRMKEGDEEVDPVFRNAWLAKEQASRRFMHQFLNREETFSEFGAVRQVLEALPGNSQLHAANSMPVRYVNLCGVGESVEVFANRGTSGIDGCLSTAVGAALASPDTLVTALIGDVAFFYDRNALWNAHVPANLRIVLLNNHGGNIFRIIEGPSRQPELETFFETPHSFSGENTARDAGVGYQLAAGFESLPAGLDWLYAPSTSARLLEIQTDRAVNAEVFGRYREGAKALF